MCKMEPRCDSEVLQCSLDVDAAYLLFPQQSISENRASNLG